MDNSNYNPQKGNTSGNIHTVEMMDGGDNKKIVIAFLVGVIIGFGSFWLWDKGQDDGDSSDKKDDASKEMVAGEDDVTVGDDTVSVGVSSSAISVSDQPAGDTVVIGKVILAKSGWVAVQDDESGQPGRILGARRFDAGEATGTVSLLRNTVAGNTYHVVLRSDDGVEGFDPATDTALTDSTSKVVSTSFKALEAEL